MAHSSLLNTISLRQKKLFSKRGSSVTANAITATAAVTRKTVDKHTKKVLIKRNQLTVSG